MAVPVRGQDTPLARRRPLDATLREEPYRFGFFQAVRVLERMFPERRPVGGDSPPAQEAVRFRALLSMAFPPSQIFDLQEHQHDRHPAELTVSFIGLTGNEHAVRAAASTVEFTVRA